MSNNRNTKNNITYVCEYCEADVSEDEVKCPNCGADVSAIVTDDTPQEKNSQLITNLEKSYNNNVDPLNQPQSIGWLCDSCGKTDLDEHQGDVKREYYLGEYKWKNAWYIGVGGGSSDRIRTYEFELIEHGILNFCRSCIEEEIAEDKKTAKFIEKITLVTFILTVLSILSFVVSLEIIEIKSEWVNGTLFFLAVGGGFLTIFGTMLSMSSRKEKTNDPDYINKRIPPIAEKVLSKRLGIRFTRPDLGNFYLIMNEKEYKRILDDIEGSKDGVTSIRGFLPCSRL